MLCFLFFVSGSNMLWFLTAASSLFVCWWQYFYQKLELLFGITTISDTHIHLTALCPGQPRWALTRKVKPIWILLKQETVIGSGISCLICKSAPYSRQITTQAYHYSVFDQLDAISAAQSTASNSEGILTAYNAPVHPIDGAGRIMFSGCPVPRQAEALTTGLPLNSGCKF